VTPTAAIVGNTQVLAGARQVMTPLAVLGSLGLPQAHQPENAGGSGQPGTTHNPTGSALYVKSGTGQNMLPHPPSNPDAQYVRPRLEIPGAVKPTAAKASKTQGKTALRSSVRGPKQKANLGGHRYVALCVFLYMLLFFCCSICCSMCVAMYVARCVFLYMLLYACYYVRCSRCVARYVALCVLLCTLLCTLLW
jgi:hypothetical protein